MVQEEAHSIAMSSSIICWLGPEPAVLCELFPWKTIPHSAELFQSPGNPGKRQQRAAAGDGERKRRARESQGVEDRHSFLQT